MFSAIADGFGFLFRLLMDGFLFILNGIMKIFKPLLDLIGAFFYLIYKLGIVLVKVIEIVISLAKMLIGIGIGLFKTIAGLSYSGSSAAMPGSYNNAFSKLRPTMNLLQLDNVAYLFIFAIWIFAALAAVKIIGAMKGGGGSD